MSVTRPRSARSAPAPPRFIVNLFGTGNGGSVDGEQVAQPRVARGARRRARIASPARPTPTSWRARADATRSPAATAPTRSMRARRRRARRRAGQRHGHRRLRRRQLDGRRRARTRSPPATAPTRSATRARDGAGDDHARRRRPTTARRARATTSGRPRARPAARGTTGSSATTSAATCSAGPGNDSITAGRAEDRVEGNEGDDTIDTRDGRFDSIDCGAGNDTLFADPGDSAEQLRDRARRGRRRLRCRRPTARPPTRRSTRARARSSATPSTRTATAVGAYLRVVSPVSFGYNRDAQAQPGALHEVHDRRGQGGRQDRDPLLVQEQGLPVHDQEGHGRLQAHGQRPLVLQEALPQARRGDRGALDAAERDRRRAAADRRQEGHDQERAAVPPAGGHEARALRVVRRQRARRAYTPDGAGDGDLRRELRHGREAADRAAEGRRHEQIPADLDRASRGGGHPDEASGGVDAAPDDARPALRHARRARGRVHARLGDRAAREHVLRVDHAVSERTRGRDRLAADPTPWRSRCAPARRSSPPRT